MDAHQGLSRVSPFYTYANSLEGVQELDPGKSGVDGGWEPQDSCLQNPVLLKALPSC